VSDKLGNVFTLRATLYGYRSAESAGGGRAERHSRRHGAGMSASSRQPETWLDRWNRVTAGRNYEAALTMLREPSVAPEAIAEAAACLHWALDLMDIYDEMAITQFGQSEHAVPPELHIEAKLRARAALEALEGVL